MRWIRFVCGAIFLGVTVALVSTAPPAQAQGKGKGKGIGQSVSVLAKSGVHGPQLAASVKALQAAKGIGNINGQAKGKGKQ